MARTERTIALVNDDPTLLHLFTDLLESEGYWVEPHADATAALPALRRDPPALLVLDIRLARLHEGFALLAALAQEPSLARIPVIACAATRSLLESHAAWPGAGRCTTLFKPFALDDLLALIRDRLTPAPEPAEAALTTAGATAAP